jgi:hypothetical protein
MNNSDTLLTIIPIFIFPYILPDILPMFQLPTGYTTEYLVVISP